MLRRLLRTLLRTPVPLDGTIPSGPQPLRSSDAHALGTLIDERYQALAARIENLAERVYKLERAEAARAAEHSAMVDQLERLYKRVSARIAREAEREDIPRRRGSDDDGESVLDLKNRLKR